MTDTPSWQDLLDLVAQLNGSDYESASVQFGDVSVRLSKSPDAALAPAAAPIPAPASATAPVAPAPAASAVAAPSAPTTNAPAPVSHGETIDAPMIGVFYRRPSPGADPFVQPGDQVDADTTIGIIEIMKLMNPITAGVAGVLGEFLVEDGSAVEFGQPLVTVTR